MRGRSAYYCTGHSDKHAGIIGLVAIARFVAMKASERTNGAKENTRTNNREEEQAETKIEYRHKDADEMLNSFYRIDSILCFCILFCYRVVSLSLFIGHQFSPRRLHNARAHGMDKQTSQQQHINTQTPSTHSTPPPTPTPPPPSVPRSFLSSFLCSLFSSLFLLRSPADRHTIVDIMQIVEMIKEEEEQKEREEKQPHTPSAA